MKRRLVAVALSLALGAALTLRVARGAAQDNESPPATPEATLDPAYEAAIRAGVDAQSAGDFARAHAEFERAHALYPNARALRAMAIASYRDSQFRRAAEEMEGALDHPEKALDARLREGALELLARARRQLGEVSVSVTVPQVAEITIDDEGRALSTREPIWLDPGPHTLHVRASGMRPQDLAIEARRGTRVELHVTLAAVDVAPLRPSVSRDDRGPSVAPRALTAAERAHRRRVWGLWTSASVAVLSGGLALTSYAMGRRRIERIDAECRDLPDGGCSPEEKRALSEDAHLTTLERTLNASLIAGLSTTAAALAIATWDYHANGKRFTLWLSSDTVTLRARF